MELGKQIKKYRMDKQLSQEQLAERIFVSRQTISNWENDKNYPDIKSLLLMSEVFEVSLDNLVKGDLEEMKIQIKNEDIKEFKKLDIIFTVCLLLVMITPIPLLKYLGTIAGALIWLAEFGIAMYFALKLEKFKKNHDIQTYREIVAFTNGETLSEKEKVQENAKNPYQKILLAISTGVITLIVCVIMWVLFILK